MSPIRQIILDFLTNTFTNENAVEFGFCFGLYLTVVSLYFKTNVPYEVKIIVGLFLSVCIGLVMPVLRDLLIYIIVYGLPSFAQKVIVAIILAVITVAIIDSFNVAKTRQKTQTTEHDAE